MSSSKNSDFLEEVKQIDLVYYLSSLGYEPIRIRGNDFWYLSPLRIEKTASFKINRKLNRWYDFGLGRGGSLIDLGIHLENCSIADVISKIKDSKLIFPRNPTLAVPLEYHKQNKIEILSNTPLRSVELLEYLQHRRIAISIADLYCRELTYRVKNNQYKAIGFANRSGGFELRNHITKISTFPKDISHFATGNREIQVFEGFMDFLTFRTLNKQIDDQSADFLILNSVSLFERAKQVLATYDRVGLFFDQDSAGRALTERALCLGAKFYDQSELYQGYKDLNDWVMEYGKRQTLHPTGTLRIK